MDDTQNRDSKRSVVLMQLGGPDTQEAVEGFLYNLFVDPEIIDLPGAFLFRKPLARLISSRRAPKARKLYALMGGGSPILAETRQQAESLKAYLASQGEDVAVEIAMRYWHPLTNETLTRLVASGTRSCILLPLYPHYSTATTGSSVREWDRWAARLDGQAPKTHIIEHYHDHPLYIAALVDRIQEALARVPGNERDKVHLVFSAHGTPMKLVRAGDPYSEQIRRTCDLVLNRGDFGLPHHLCFQSKVGPQRWLEPSLLQTIARLATEKVTHMVVIPVSFVSEHLETLVEINIEARHAAAQAGIRYFDVTRALSTSEKFIACLGTLVLSRLRSLETA